MTNMEQKTAPDPRTARASRKRTRKSPRHSATPGRPERFAAGDAVESISKAGPYRESTNGIRHRFVVHSDNPRRRSPFIQLVESWMAPDADMFGMHPHRGFETVTLVLKGSERYRDHLGTEGLAQAGDVQWTRAARGILHSSKPEGDEPLHVLQLWLNLPASMKSAEPRTCGQRLAETAASDDDGVQVIVHAGEYQGRVQPHLSLWALALIEAKLAAERSVTLRADPTWRSFVYVITGEIRIGGRTVSEGEVAWIGSSGALDPGVRAETAEGAHVVFYSSPPIDEPVAVRGPFVMNTKDEIRQAYADLSNGTFI